MHDAINKLKCMDIEAWRAATRQELSDYYQARVIGTAESPFRSVLAVRQHLSLVDMYCYLKARFGEPNGIQNLLRRDDSDNWIHWDFNLKVDREDIYICGTYREVHLMLSEELTDEGWRDLILKIKSDYGRLGKEKAAVLHGLEKWVIFPNKFFEISTICSVLHAQITDGLRLLPDSFPIFSSKEDKQQQTVSVSRNRRLARRYFKLYRDCLELSLLTPVLAEAFINMLILILCKKEIKDNKRQFEAFIRSQIDAKIFDLAYKCEGFKKKINQDASKYKNFKRVMDKRNNAIHGNVDPEREQIEIIYFEGKRPLFKEPGDHIAKYFEALARQHEPETVIKDYEDTHLFLWSIAEYLEPGIAK